MQPYFFPYIGYYQLIAAVDEFVIYDNIKYTKKGWINRNRILVDGRDEVISIPLRKGSDSLLVVERELAADFNRGKLLNQIRGAYSRAPCFPEVYPLLERVVRYEALNLFDYIYQSLQEICNYIGIGGKFVVSSDVAIDHSLRSQDKVIALCKKRGFDVYVNPSGGRELYSRDAFASEGIDLKFIRNVIRSYPQGGGEFVANLSIIDALMWVDRASLATALGAYELVD